MPDHPAGEERPQGIAFFATTHWSVVLAAGDADSGLASAALETLCRTYWYPLYAYARRRGLGQDEAKDTIQGLFEQLLSRGSLLNRSPEQGRFRSFLLSCLNYYMADARDKATAAKRGGSQPTIALDALDAEERYRFEPVEALTPEKIYERRWALTLLQRVVQRLERECEAAGQQAQFQALRPYILGSSPESNYDEIASALKMSGGSLRVSAHRLRQRCRELLREEVAQTVENAADVEEELRYLRGILAS